MDQVARPPMRSFMVGEEKGASKLSSSFMDILQAEVEQSKAEKFQAHFLIRSAEEKDTVCRAFAVNCDKRSVRIIDTFYRQKDSSLWLRARLEGLAAIRANVSPSWCLVESQNFSKGVAFTEYFTEEDIRGVLATRLGRTLFPPPPYGLPCIGEIVYDRFSNADGTAKLDTFLYRPVCVFTLTMDKKSVMETVKRAGALGLELCETKIMLQLKKDEEAEAKFGREVSSWRESRGTSWEAVEDVLEDVQQGDWMQVLNSIPRDDE